MRQALRHCTHRGRSNLDRSLKQLSVSLSSLLVTSIRLKRGCADPIEEALSLLADSIVGGCIMGSWEPDIQACRPQSGLTPVRQANQQVWLTKRHQQRYGVANCAEDKSHSVLLGVGVLPSGLPLKVFQLFLSFTLLAVQL